jgi:two-component sensor histidine kinase
MQLAVASLYNAQKYKVSSILPDEYALIGTLHKENSNYPMALMAAQKGVDIAKQNNDTSEYIELLGLKAMFIRGHSMHFHTPVEKDSSLAIRLMALKIAESNPKYERLCVPFYDNICQHYDLVKDYPKAKYYGYKGIALALKYNQKRSLTYSYAFLGEALFFSGDRQQAMLYLQNALQIATGLKQPYRIMELNNDLSRFYKLSGDYKNALYYEDRYIALIDSIQVRVNVKQIAEVQIKYESIKKDEALALLNLADRQKSKQLRWLLIGAVLFLFLVVILAYMYRIIRLKNSVLVANNVQINEQSVNLGILLKELHHRVKNNLQIVSSMLNLQAGRMEDNEARQALDVSRQRIEAMSIIHNSLYQRDNANKVDMKEFLPILLWNIMDSFGINRKEIDISMEILVTDIDVDMAMPLGLVINEWVTNIFKHAYKNMQGRPYMEILIFYNDGSLKLKINDNGVGMPLPLWENPKSSFGVKLMKILIKQVGGIARVSNVLGTTIELDIPYSKNNLDI